MKNTGILKYGAAGIFVALSGCATDSTTIATDGADEELGVVVASCTTGTGWFAKAGTMTLANSATYAAAAGTLVVDTSGTSNSVVNVYPGNGMIKVNGRTCTDGTGKTLALKNVNYLVLEGKAGSNDTFILDFTAGAPVAPLLGDQHIVVDGGEVGGATNTDSLIVRTTGGADTIAVGQSTCYVGGGSCNGAVGGQKGDAAFGISFSITSPVAHILFKNGADTTANAGGAAHNPSLSFDLSGGKDTFTAMPASFEKVSNVATMTAVTTAAVGTGGTVPGMTIFGGAGDDTIIPGKGPDKINGGGDSGDVVDYSARTANVNVELSSTAVGIWGPDLRGRSVAVDDCFDITWNGGSATQVAFGAAAATPLAIVKELNKALVAAGGGHASGITASGKYLAAQLVGPYLFLRGDSGARSITLAATGTSCPNAGTNALAAGKLNLTAGTTSAIGNDGESGEKDDIQAVASVIGGSGNDVLFGTATTNTLTGGAGDDVINGGPAPSTYDASHCTADADKLNGGAGNDWFDMNNAADCAATVAGGADTDLVDYHQRTAALTIALSGAAASGDQAATPAEKDNLGTDLEVVLGGSDIDTITGSPSNDFLYGGAGADVIKGALGDDVLVGGAGADELNGEGGDDVFFELNAEPAANTTYGVSSIYWPVGGAGVVQGVNWPLPVYSTWAAGGTFATGAFVSPGNGFYYKVTGGGGGAAGTTAPTWPTAVNATVTDGALTWTCWSTTGPAFLGIAKEMLADKPGDGNDTINGGNTAGENNHLYLGTDVGVPSNAASGGCPAATLCYTACIEPKSIGVTTGGACDPATTGVSYDGVSTANVTNNYVNIQWVSGDATGKNILIGSGMGETLEGGSLVDVIVGMDGVDFIYGFADTQASNAAVDILCGGNDSDSINGGSAAKLEGEGAGADGVYVTNACVAMTYANASSCFGTSQSCSPNVALGFDQCFGNTTTADVKDCPVNQ